MHYIGSWCDKKDKNDHQNRNIKMADLVTGLIGIVLTALVT